MASDTELWRGTDYGWWLAADTSGAVGASLIAFAVPLMMLATTGSSAAATAESTTPDAPQISMSVRRSYRS